VATRGEVVNKPLSFDEAKHARDASAKVGSVMTCHGSRHVLSWLVMALVTYCHGLSRLSSRIVMVPGHEAFPGTLQGYVCIHANAAVAVRSCVKPNEIKSSSKFNEMRVRHQVGNGDGA